MKQTPGDRLTEWRRLNGLTQDQAARMLVPPTSQGTWSAWEIGTKHPGLASALGIEALTGSAIKADAWTRPRRNRSSSQRKSKAA